MRRFCQRNRDCDTARRGIQKKQKKEDEQENHSIEAGAHEEKVASTLQTVFGG